MVATKQHSIVQPYCRTCLSNWLMIELMIKRIDSIKTGPYYKTLTHCFLPKLSTKETRKT